MIILQDTRERRPLYFQHPYIEETRICKLDVGDYTAQYNDGHTSMTYFERKGSLADLWKTLTKDYPRFKKEVMRARESDFTLILIIEGSLLKVLAGYDRSEVSGISIVKTIFSLWVRYNVMPVFCRNDIEMAEFITHYFLAEQRKRKEKDLTNKKTGL